MWVRGHLAGIKSPLSLNGSRDLTQVIGLGSMLLYLLPPPPAGVEILWFLPRYNVRSSGCQELNYHLKNLRPDQYWQLCLDGT